MSQQFAAEVCFEGGSSIISLPYSMKWIDLEVMLKCCFDLAEIKVKYIDNEDDQIAISCEEEFQEALRISRQCGDVIRMIILNKDETVENQENSKQMEIIDIDDIDDFTPDVRIEEPITKEPIGLNPTNAGKDKTENKRYQSKSRPAPKSRTGKPKASADYYSNLATNVGKFWTGNGTTASKDSADQSKPSGTMSEDLGKKTSKSRTSKPKVSVDYYSKLASNVGKFWPNTNPTASKEDTPSKPCATEFEKPGRNGTSAVAMPVPKPRKQAGSPTACDEFVPLWFSNEKSKITSEVVKGVLDGLQGAVIDTIPGSSPIKSSPTSTQVRYLHTGIICDACDNQIVGIRYKCGNCEDYDLCEACEMNENIHNPEHVFVKLRRPVAGVGVRYDGKRVPLIKHSIYGESFEERMKKLEQRATRKAEKAEIKRKLKMKKMKRQAEICVGLSPTKREKIEQFSEKKARMIVDNATTETDESHMTKMDAAFVAHANIPDDSHLQPGTKFIKNWTMKNTGDVNWDKHTQLQYQWGNIPLISTPLVSVPPLNTNKEGCVSVEFVAPISPGEYESHWRLTDRGRSQQFGQRVWCRIIVDQREILEIKEEVVEAVIVKQEVSNKLILDESSRDCDTDLAATAVARLQISPQETTQVISSELLTAQDILSFEMLRITDRKESDGRPASTATPNNTPIGLTPCISPVPHMYDEEFTLPETCVLDIEGETTCDTNIVEEEIEAATSDVEITHAADDVCVETNSNKKEEIDQTADQVDCEVLSTCSDDLLEDFIVVPLPDCFNTDIPITSSISIRRDSVASQAGSSMIRSCSVSVCTNDSGTEVQEQPTGQPVKDVDEILCTSQDIQTVPLIPIVAVATAVIGAQQHADEAESIVIVEETIIPEVVRHDEGVIPEILQDGEETFHDAAETTDNMHVASDDDSDATDDDEDDEDNQEHPQDRGISTVGEARRDVYDEHDPMDLLGVATVRAASIAGIIAKQVYDGAASSVQALFGTQQNEKPARDFPRDHVHYDSAMDQLIEMGFGNREENSRLLTKCNDNIHLTVQELLAGGENNWSDIRH